MYIKGKYLHYGNDLKDVFEIRKQVFQIEQGVSQELEQDEYDNEAIHALVYKIGDDEVPVATGRLIFIDSEYRIGRICVLKEERKQGYGDFLVKMLIDKAFLAGAKYVSVHAQEKAIGFYEKIGFKICGDSYMEAGINHFPMEIKPTDVCRDCQSKLNAKKTL